MKALEIWSHSQLKLVLKSSEFLSNYAWSKDALLQALSCANNTTSGGKSGFAYDMLAFVCFVLSSSATTPSTSKHTTLNIDACVQLYKDPSLPTAMPKLFGCVFAIILSLGHQSSVWKDRLSRDERSILYAAQAHLVRLDEHRELSLGWLSRPKSLIVSPGGGCQSCQQYFHVLWNASFGQCGTLNSAMPLEDVSKVVRLPIYRQKFAANWACETKCGTREETLKGIDVRLEELYAEFTSKYKRVAR
jgi:hypothetical protein